MPLVHWETKTPSCRRSRFVTCNSRKKRNSFCALEGWVQFREPPSNHYMWSWICLIVNTHCFLGMSTLLWAHVTLWFLLVRQGCRILGSVNFFWSGLESWCTWVPSIASQDLPPSFFHRELFSSVPFTFGVGLFGNFLDHIIFSLTFCILWQLGIINNWSSNQTPEQCNDIFWASRGW